VAIQSVQISINKLEAPFQTKGVVKECTFQPTVGRKLLLTHTVVYSPSSKVVES